VGASLVVTGGVVVLGALVLLLGCGPGLFEQPVRRAAASRIRGAQQRARGVRRDLLIKRLAG